MRHRMTVTSRSERTCGARDHLTRYPAQSNETTDPDADRMQVLYAEYAAEISRYALRLTGDRARAEDVVQETLLRAWQHPEAIDEDERSPRAALHCRPQHDHR
jgi:Sigma-70 region 2